MRRSVHIAPAKDWWRHFFQPVVGEVLFCQTPEKTDIEVAQVLKKTTVRPAARILDLACGVGRHSLAFARRGFEVTGLDYSRPYLRQAKDAAKKAGAAISFIHGDMKNLRACFDAGEFDLAVSLFNSFGYFGSRRDDSKVLKEVHHVLRPGGRFIINTLNGRGVANRLKAPVSMGQEPLPNLFLIDAARYDARKQKTECDWTIIDARRRKTKVLRLSFTQNVYSHAALTKLLRAAGFSIETTWGALTGEPFDEAKSWHQTVVARKRR